MKEFTDGDAWLPFVAVLLIIVMFFLGVFLGGIAKEAQFDPEVIRIQRQRSAWTSYMDATEKK